VCTSHSDPVCHQVWHDWHNPTPHCQNFPIPAPHCRCQSNPIFIYPPIITNMRQDNLPRLPDHHRRYWYCPHNPAGDRRESGTLHPSSETPIPEEPKAPGAPNHTNPRYCVHCPAPTHCIPLLTYDLPTPHPNAQTTATNPALPPPPVQDALLPTFPPHVHPRMRHPRSHDTATDHSSSLSSKHQHCTSLSWEQEDHGISVSRAYWPEGNKPLTDMPGKPSDTHMSFRSPERQHVGAGDSFLELSETTVTEKAWRMLHQLLNTLCL